MTRKIRWLRAVGLALGLLLADRGAAAQDARPQPAADPAVWGIYARLAGTTRQAGSDGYRLHWRWSQPGKELVEEYFAPSSGKLMHTSKITPGPGPGTLHAVGSSLGGKEWNGTLQADGSVVFAGTGMLKMSYMATMGSDGAYEIRRVKLRDGVVWSISEPAKYNRYLPLDATTPGSTSAVAGAAEPGKTLTAATAGSVGAAPGLPVPASAATGSLSTPVAAVAAAAAQPPAVAPQQAAPPSPLPIDPAQLKQQNRTIRDYYERAINGPTGTQGVWLEMTGSGSGISRYRKTENGVESNFTFIRENGELAIIQSILHFDDEGGRIIRYVDGAPVVSARITRMPGGAFRVQTLPGFGVSEDDAAGSFEDVTFVADRQEILSATGKKKAYRWAPESEASSVQASIQKRQQWLETQRVLAAQAEAEQNRRRQEEAQALAAMLQQQAAAEQERLAYEAEADADFEAERVQRAAQWARTAGAAEQGLADSISRLNGTVSSVQAQQAQYRAQQQAAEMAAANARRQSDLENARAATQRQYDEAARLAAQQRAAEQQRAATAATSGATQQGNPGAGSGTAAAGGSVWFVFCAAIKPGAYMDAPGAMFLSDIASTDRKNYAAMQAQEAFASRVNAQYGVSVGSSSCTSYPDRAAAQAGWQSQHDSFGMKFYKKVATGIPAVP